MTQGELLDFMEDTFKSCLETARKKNTDYAGASGESPFANFECSEVVGVPVARGMLVRLMDKIKRVSNLLDQDALVVDEAVEDTLDDAINYVALIKAYLASTGEVPLVVAACADRKWERVEADLDSYRASVPIIIPITSGEVGTDSGDDRRGSRAS